MKYLLFYTILSIFIGIFQLIDGVLLSIKGQTTLNTIFAAIEFLWVLFSIFAIYKYKKESFHSLIPKTYVIYNIMGWCYGTYLTLQSQNKNMVDIPIWFAILGAFYGGFFTVMNFKMYRQIRKNRKESLLESSSI